MTENGQLETDCGIHIFAYKCASHDDGLLKDAGNAISVTIDFDIRDQFYLGIKLARIVFTLDYI